MRVISFRIYRKGGCTFAPGSPVAVPSPFLFYTVFSYYVPTVTMGFAYAIVLTRTYRELRRRGKSASSALKRRFEITRTLFFSFMWLCIAVYPINIVASLAPREFGTNLSLQLALRWLSTSFGCMNPVGDEYGISKKKSACIKNPFRNSRYYA